MIWEYIYISIHASCQKASAKDNHIFITTWYVNLLLLEYVSYSMMHPGEIPDDIGQESLAGSVNYCLI